MMSVARFAHFARSGWFGLPRGFAVAAVFSVLGVANVAFASGGGGSLHINWWAWDAHAPPVGWFILDFALFVYILYRAGAAPLRGVFERRHVAIKEGLIKASSARKRAEAEHDESQRNLAGTDGEIAALVETARTDGASQRDHIVAEAGVYCARLRRDGQKLAEQETLVARQELGSDIAERSLGRARVLLDEKITDDDRARLLDAAIVELEGLDAISPGGVS